MPKGLDDVPADEGIALLGWLARWQPGMGNLSSKSALAPDTIIHLPLAGSKRYGDMTEADFRLVRAVLRAKREMLDAVAEVFDALDAWRATDTTSAAPSASPTTGESQLWTWGEVATALGVNRQTLWSRVRGDELVLASGQRIPIITFGGKRKFVSKRALARALAGEQWEPPPMTPPPWAKTTQARDKRTQ